jgi:hypothetical protein
MWIAAFSDEAFAAYLAGFTDGEGWLGVTPHGVRITIANCELQVLEQIRDRLGYGTIKSQHFKAEWRRRYVLDIANYEACSDFVRRVRPFFQIKGPIADAMLAKAARKTRERERMEARDEAVRNAARDGTLQTEIAKRFGMSQQNVCRILRGHDWPSNRGRAARRRKRNSTGQFLPSA